MDKKINLAIIIVNWNVKNLLRDCLHSVFADIKNSHLSAQVWVVDSASTDGSVAMVQAEFPSVHLIASEQNLGFAGGNNAALQAMGFPNQQGKQPEAVLLLNPDTLIKPGALVAMQHFMATHPHVGIVGANLSYGDGSFQHGNYGFPGLWQLAIELLPLPGRLYESRLNGRYPHSLYQSNTPFPIDHPLGAAMLIRDKAIWQTGLLDKGYHMYVEEVDWAWRIKAAGWQAYCVPTAHIIHLGGQSTGQIKTQSFLNLWQSRHRFYKKHYSWLKNKIANLIVQWGMNRKIKQDPENKQTFKTIKTLWQKN